MSFETGLYGANKGWNQRWIEDLIKMCCNYTMPPIVMLLGIPALTISAPMTRSGPMVSWMRVVVNERYDDSVSTSVLHQSSLIQFTEGWEDDGSKRF